MKKLIIMLAMTLAAGQVMADNVKLTLELSGLEPMKGQHYEGWNIVSGKALTTGRFAIDKEGKIHQVDSSGKSIKVVGMNGKATFEVGKDQLKSSLFVLTIEPNNDMDDSPSSVHIMGGNYKNQEAGLTVDHGSSIGTNFNSVTGSFILAAPTGGNFNQGIWFVDPANGSGSLDLPELPTGWAYEGWIVNTSNGKKFSTGIFQNANKVDADGAGFLAGPLKLSTPPTPGQDIVKSSVVLDDGIHAAVISVEPYPDFDKAPYAIKILKADISMGAPGMTSLNLMNISSKTLPSGKAHLH